ncbi:MAG TPA: 2-phospho-L-lactate transferase CofD family protein [Candidatus Methanoperedens sp.]|nr:2-phospho-L-lactate transferase CofD family protein [Candidatus Methanoperedens sp.]
MNTKTKICTIGGGTGMPVINEALVKAGFSGIKSIVTTFDNGGDTGRLITDERGQILANSDYWRSLISLWKDGEQKKIWVDMLRYRDGRARNFGNIFFQFMSEKSGSLADVDVLFKNLTLADLKGEVIPISLSPASICMETKSGKKYIGEHFLDDLRMSRDYVTKLWLDPKVEANPEAIEAMLNAEVIIVCPGSVYGSLITNFLTKGICEAFTKSKAKKILMVNIMSSANEGDVKNQNDYLNLYKKFLDIDFDVLLMADLKKLDSSKLKKVMDFYDMENSEHIEYVEEANKNTVLTDIATIDEVNWRLRHSKLKLARFFAKM